MKMLRDLKRTSEQPKLSARQQRKARKLNRRIRREVIAKLCDDASGATRLPSGRRAVASPPGNRDIAVTGMHHARCVRQVLA